MAFSASTSAELNAVADGTATAASVHCTVYDGGDAVKTTDKSAQDYSGCRSADGRIWFPSSKGMVVIDPAHVPSNSQPPIVSLEQVRINGQEYRLDKDQAIEPGPEQSRIRLHGPGLPSPAKDPIPLPARGV